MTAWPAPWGPPARLSPIRWKAPSPGVDLRRLGALGLLCCALVAEGLALTQSYVWAAPLLGLLLIAAAVDIPLIPFFGAVLLVRVLSDDTASTASRHSGSLNLSALIAVVFILVAVGLLAYRRRGLVWAAAIGFAICVWVAVAARSHGLSTLTMREGIRELSVAAVAVVAYNARRALDMSIAARLIQLAGSIAALLAIYQLATHGGILVDGEIRSNGTFSHPNAAAVFFAIATVASLWLYTDRGRRPRDLLLTLLFAAATISTFSIDGFATLLTMIAVFGLLRPGSGRLKVRLVALVAVLAVVFLATPIGSDRIASESSPQVGAGAAAAEGNSLAWRFYKWETLLPEWERSPLVGQGLGTTVTSEATSQSTTVGNLPHNEYIRYLVETGAVGFALLLAGLLTLIAKLNRGRRLLSIGNATVLALAVVIGLLVNALAANTLLYTPAAYAVALLVGVALRLGRDGRLAAGATVAG